MQKIRTPAVAGSFYPADPLELTKIIDNFVSHTHNLFSQRAKAFIVPHAGYVYSGSTAAEVYQLIGKQKQTIQRVVLLGPCHRVYIKGMAIPSCDSFATPLGEIPLDKTLLTEITQFSQIQISDLAHQEEHSIEVQLPFLQRCLNDFCLLPIAVGDVSFEQVAEVINYLWDLPQTIFLISSDLSHFLTDSEAKQVDEQTTRKIVNKNYQQLNHQMACGCTPIQALLEVATEKKLNVSLLKQCNSGDTAGDKSRVVGYAAYAIY